LPGLDQLSHRTHRVLDGDRLIHPVLVVEVDDVDPEALQAGVAGGPDVVRVAVDTHPRAVWLALVAELGREHNLIPAAGDGTADELLVGEGAVHVGGVEQRAAQVERLRDGGD